MVNVQLRATPGSPLAEAPPKTAATVPAGTRPHSIPVDSPVLAVVPTAIVVVTAAPGAEVSTGADVLTAAPSVVVAVSPPHATTTRITAAVRNSLYRIAPPFSPTPP
jgi:hypothetical protein